MNSGLGIAQSLQGGHIVQKLRRSEFVEQAEGLGQITQTGFQQPLCLFQWAAVYQNCALGGRQSGDQELHQGGLSRAVWAKQSDQAGRF